jgi:hypothetical protein
MKNEVQELRAELRQLKIGFTVTAVLVLVFVCLAAQSNTNPEVRTTSLVIVDANGKEIAHWDAGGIQTNSVQLPDGAKTSTLLSKEGLRTKQIVITDAGGNERARWDTGTDGQPRFGLEDSRQGVRLAMSVLDDNAGFVMSGPSKIQGFVVQMLGDVPALGLRDPVTEARFGNVYKDENGNWKADPVGRLTLSIRGRTYWTNPIPSNVNLW